MLQFRKIERFWAHLKINVYSEGWTAGSVEPLIRKIKREIKKFFAQLSLLKITTNLKL
jgi:hypothetical protein